MWYYVFGLCVRAGSGAQKPILLLKFNWKLLLKFARHPAWRNTDVRVRLLFIIQFSFHNLFFRLSVRFPHFRFCFLMIFTFIGKKMHTWPGQPRTLPNHYTVPNTVFIWTTVLWISSEISMFYSFFGKYFLLIFFNVVPNFFFVPFSKFLS